MAEVSQLGAKKFLSNLPEVLSWMLFLPVGQEYFVLKEEGESPSLESENVGSCQEMKKLDWQT